MFMIYSPPDTILKQWKWLLALGVLLIVLGCFALSFTVYATLITILVLGIILLVAGVAQCAMATRVSQWSGFFTHLLSGLLALVLGYLFIRTPGISALTLTLLVSAFLLVSGLFKIFASAAHRFPQWGWVLANGIVTLLLGILLWAQWPLSGLWAIGLFLGIDLLMAGAAWTLIALKLRQLHGNHTRGGNTGHLQA